MSNKWDKVACVISTLALVVSVGTFILSFVLS